jgi:hypothetical protein
MRDTVLVTSDAFGFDTEAAPRALTRPPAITATQNALLWLLGASGGVVFIEPSLYELLMVLSMVFFATTGMRIQISLLPIIGMILLVNIGYSIGAIPFYDQKDVVNWIFTSWYLWATVPFYAMVIADNTEARLDALIRGWLVGGAIVAAAGIAGYLHLVPGGDDLLTLYGRARGTFKDPNVLGAFLILPCLVALQRVMLERAGRALRNAVLLLILTLAVLFTFSRAAWGQLAGMSAIMLFLLFAITPSSSKRLRIIVLTGLAALGMVMLLGILLSIPSIAEIFQQRASFDQSYDEGRFGRFGRHILGAQMALDYPWGIGPLQFTLYMPEDTHNSFLNAFMSGGWISGICYPALVFTGVIQSFRYLFVPVPWRRTYVALFCAYLGTVLESAIIDTDHWRHFFLMQGTMWGLFVAARRYAAPRKSSAKSNAPSAPVAIGPLATSPGH